MESNATEIIGVFIPIIAIIGGIIMIFFLRRFENEERLAMIERGMDPVIKKDKTPGFGALRFALLAMGVGLGLLVGYMVEESFRGEEEVIYFASVFLFGGLGLLIAHFLEQRKRKEADL